MNTYDQVGARQVPPGRVRAHAPLLVDPGILALAASDAMIHPITPKGLPTMRYPIAIAVALLASVSTAAHAGTFTMALACPPEGTACQEIVKAAQNIGGPSATLAYRADLGTVTGSGDALGVQMMQTYITQAAARLNRQFRIEFDAPGEQHFVIEARNTFPLHNELLDEHGKGTRIEATATAIGDDTAQVDLNITRSHDDGTTTAWHIDLPAVLGRSTDAGAGARITVTRL